MYHVLVTDDDALMRNVIKKIVSNHQHFQIVAEAANGEEAIKVCENQKIDLVMLDIVMPQKNGIDTAKELHARFPDITIFFISTFSDAAYIKQVLEFHRDKYLQKPINMTLLRNLLDDYHKKNIRKGLCEDIPPYEVNNLTYLETIKASDTYIDFLCHNQELASSDLYDQLIYMANELYHQILVVTANVDLLSIYPLQKEWLKIPELVKLWFFQIINYVWQKRSVHRYDILKIVFSYIDQNIKKNISLADIVSHCSVSQGYLSRIFRDQFSMSVMDYIKYRKIHIIKINLIFTSKSVLDISEYIGYTDSKYMGKVFKKEEGISLNDYRKKYFP